ncbi:tyrosine-type recombinase/integrase [Lentzea albidocapillata]|uniref:tyrosine-type recombinase/integrase n=1 Tax=Lentzea albidocapillata TaxID=40571 RepID=UPI000A00E81B|nr:tyrosine-type recombinase/integrase [Lentzea albidocapillata]
MERTRVWWLCSHALSAVTTKTWCRLSGGCSSASEDEEGRPHGHHHASHRPRKGGERVGKSQKSCRLLALDSFTVAVLASHFQQLEKEKQDWGDAYRDHGLAFCWDDGRPIYPDTITEEFNKLVDLLELPKIRFHDIRHTYATISLRAGVHPKIVSSRLGHATVAFMLDTYSADIEDLDRDAAEAVIGLFLPPSQKGLV